MSGQGHTVSEPLDPEVERETQPQLVSPFKCLACGASFPDSSGWPCARCGSGPLVRLLVMEAT